MIVVNEEVREYIQRNSRRFKARLCLEDGIIIGGDIRSLSINKGSCGNSNFEPACIFSNYVDVKIDNCTAALTNKKIKVEIGLTVNGVEYWYTVATVYASKPSKKANRTTFTGLGVMSAKLGKKYAGGTYTTVSSLLSYLETVAGCPIILEEGLEDLTIPAVDLSEYYYREIIGLIAGLFFGYATENARGEIEIRTFNKTDGTVEAFPSRMFEDPDFYEPVTVEGIQVLSSDDTEFTYGSLQNCSLTNPLMTQEIFDKYHNNYVGFTYEPYDGLGMTLGDFTIEASDLINITDREGKTHNLHCMSITHEFDGGLKTSLSCPTLDNGEDYSRGTTSKEAGIAYDALISGNFGSGGTGEIPDGISNIPVFKITGDNISNGTGWIDSGGAQAFMCLDFDIPADFNSSESFSGTLNFDTEYNLDPYYNTYKGLYDYITIPLFYYNGTEYFSAGGLSVSIIIYPKEKRYTANVGYSNAYLFTELGALSTYNATTGTYDALVSASFQVNISWLLNNVVV